MTTIDHPAHYQTAGHGQPGNLEAIDIIEAYGLDESFALGNALKYLLRAGRKGGDLAVDVRKARWYVARAIVRGETFMAPDAWPDVSPERVVEAYGLTGARADAVIELLWQALGEPADADIVDLIDRAIAETNGSSAE